MSEPCQAQSCVFPEGSAVERRATESLEPSWARAEWGPGAPVWPVPVGLCGRRASFYQV